MKHVIIIVYIDAYQRTPTTPKYEDPKSKSQSLADSSTIENDQQNIVGISSLEWWAS